MRILFIAGSGRTGSTLLSLLLSQSDETFNVGQVRDLPQAFVAGERCSCGEPITRCGFWGEVLTRVYGAEPEAARAAAQRAGAAFKRFRGAIDPRALWDDGSAAAELARSHEGVLDEMARRYRACAAVSGARVLVDSSKSPEVALLLGALPDADLRVLNLVRDPRAVACSWEKKHGDLGRVAHQCRAWRDRQRQLAAFGRRHPDRFMKVTYEAFVARPRATVESILRWAGLDHGLDFFRGEDRATLSWARQHLFPPVNEAMLAERPTEVHIEPRDAWRRTCSLKTRWLAARLTFPDNLLHGYGPF